MPDNNQNIKQQVVERIKQSTNILITVSTNPSVDALSAMLALTLLINKLDKHGAAVFSGAVPPAINFLEPSKTFEHNVDSLRDFIIALDKEKADRLRYKVEDDVVKIFITPYKTTISEKDLQFSQGDFNVDLIIALGVEKREELDQAIVAHGRILHDATVITINTADQKSSLGSIDWHEPKSSSLSEILASIADTIKPGILDQQISTALLTGIVAATERFSNQRTTPQVMTIAAQLMAAGANQQLIASNLQGVQPIPTEAPVKLKSQEGGVISNIPAAPAAESKKPDGEMQIDHKPPQLPVPPAAETLPKPEPPISISPPPIEPPAPGSRTVNASDTEEPEITGDLEEGYINGSPSWKGRTIKPLTQPSFGGSLSATSQQALDDGLLSLKTDQNKKILTHSEPDEPSALPNKPQTSPTPQFPKPIKSPNLPKIEKPSEPPSLPPVPPPASVAPLPYGPTIEQIEQDMHKQPATPVDHGADLQAARAAVDEALESMPAANEAEAAIGSQPLPPISPITQLAPGNTPLPPIGQLPPDAPSTTSPAPSLPPLPQMPDFNKLPPLPPPLPDSPPSLPPSPTLPPSGQPSKPQDPGRFHIPGL